MQDRKDVLAVILLVKGCETVFLLNRFKEAIMVGLILQLQNHYRIIWLSRVNDLLQMTVTTKTCYVLSRHARIRKILLKW